MQPQSALSSAQLSELWASERNTSQSLVCLLDIILAARQITSGVPSP